MCGERMIGNAIFLQDPVHISQVQRLVDTSIRRRATEPMRQKTMKGRRVFSTVTGQGWIAIPAEIKCLIMDHLHGKDVGHGIIALGWRLPDRYWRSRFPRDIIFEVGDFDLGEIDWQHLCMEVEWKNLLHSPKAVRN